MRIVHRPAALAALTILAFAAPAPAAIFTITWEGTLATGSYTVNSDPGIDLANKAFSVVYTIDDSLGADGSSLPDFASITGGPVFGQPTSPVSAIVTIEGFAPLSIAGNSLSSASRVNYSPISTFPDAASYQTEDQIDEIVGDISHHRTSSVFSFLTETDPALHGTLFDSIAYDALPIRSEAASDQFIFSLQFNDILTDLTTSESSQVFIEASASSGWIVPTAAVPEPTSWALMIGGFAAIGGAMRRRARRMQLAFG